MTGYEKLVKLYHFVEFMVKMSKKGMPLSFLTKVFK